MKKLISGGMDKLDASLSLSQEQHLDKHYINITEGKNRSGVSSMSDVSDIEDTSDIEGIVLEDPENARKRLAKEAAEAAAEAAAAEAAAEAAAAEAAAVEAAAAAEAAAVEAAAAEAAAAEKKNLKLYKDEEYPGIGLHAGKWRVRFRSHNSNDKTRHVLGRYNDENSAINSVSKLIMKKQVFRTPNGWRFKKKY